MILSCGCEIFPSAPVSLETLRAHYKHTFEVLVFWEIMYRWGSAPNEDKLKLSQARIDLIEAIDKLYPETREEGI